MTVPVRHRTTRPAGLSSRIVRSAGLRSSHDRRQRRLRLGGSWNWTAVASVIAALAAASGVYFTGQSLEAARDGQLTDRFTKAVDQLDRAGDDHLQARLGGIYALERLARDSPRDHPTIVEVLSAFVCSKTQSVLNETCPNQGPTVDVQAALTVLGRRDPDQDQSTRVDLRYACLMYVDLTGANLTGANLTRATLYEATLINADLSGADLNSVELIYADLSGANLTRAHLGLAMLTNATLPHANLSGANLALADLRSADLNHANLTGAVVSLTNFTGVKHDQTDVAGVTATHEPTGKWW